MQIEITIKKCVWIALDSLVDKQEQIRQIFKVTRENSQIKTPQITNDCNLKMFVNFIKIISSKMQTWDADEGKSDKKKFLDWLL